jgi:hypothetical protein
MPLTNYFNKPGNRKPSEGPAVMASMKQRYGAKAGERVFYATVNKMRKGTPAQRAAQPHKPGTGAPDTGSKSPGAALMTARKRRARRGARARQLGTPPQAYGQRIEGPSSSTTRIGY